MKIYSIRSSVILFAFFFAGAIAAQDEPLLLTNGKIITLDAENSIASSVLLYRGRIEAVDDPSNALASSAREIDLEGRTVIPGLYDSHMHFIRGTLRPGYDMRGLEQANSIDELLEEINSFSPSVPEGEFITAIGGWDPIQFLGENRFPTLQELDQAATDHPFYMHLRATGPAVTNSLGKAILEEAGVTVGEDGMIASGFDSVLAYGYLKNQQTEEDRIRGAKDFMQHANSLGLTAVRDNGGTVQDGAQFFDPYADYDTMMDLWQTDELSMRVRLLLISQDDTVGDGTGSSLVEQRLRTSFMGLGDDMMRISGIGEHVVANSRGPDFLTVTRLAAEGGWTLEQHSSQPAENQFHIEAFEAANEVASIEDLRWTLTHVQQITPEIAQRLKDLGGGVTVQVHRYLNRGNVTNNQGGPPLRMLTDMGIPVGGGTDSTNAQPMNPWYSIYYMVSGKNIGGHAVNEGQELTRIEALRTYTLGSAWTTKDDDELGSIEVGKYADLVVLDRDYLTVSESEIREIQSVLTLLEGEIVYTGPDSGLSF